MLGNGAGAVYNGILGQINGDVFAGSGGDTILAGSGPTDMFGGSGADALIGGAGTDAIFAGSGDDYIQAGSGLKLIGFEPSSIIANHFDDVADFGPGTYLTLPSADLSTTSFAAFNRGTVVGVPVGGGAFFGIFVGGAARSTVQAHTIFGLELTRSIRRSVQRLARALHVNSETARRKAFDSADQPPCFHVLPAVCRQRSLACGAFGADGVRSSMQS